MTQPLTGAEKRDLKSQAQRLDAVLRVGNAGVSEPFLVSMNEALALHGLVKVKFTGSKEEKKTLAPEIAGKTGSELVMRVGNVAVFFREKPPLS